MKEKIKVLLVDDQPDFLEPISLWLREKNYAVMVAYDGRQAIEIIKTKQPDIVFLDLKMPVLDGIQTLTMLREFDKDLPVIILTAYGDERSLVKARQLAISGFFPKKGNLIQLVKIIETTLRTHKKLRFQDVKKRKINKTIKEEKK